MTEADVAREAKDVLLKQVTRTLGDDLFRRFGIDLPPIVGHVPGDLPVLEVRAQYADLLFELADDTLVNFELQSDSAPDDVLRFADYNWAAFRKYGKRTWTIVLYGPRVTARPSDHVDGGGHKVSITVILLAEHDAEAALTRLQSKVARGEPLTGVDRVDLVLLPLMRQSRPLGEVVAEALPLVDALPPEERPRTIGTIIGLAYHYLDESTAAALLEALKMANALEALIAEGILRGQQEGILRGREEGILRGREEGILRGREEGILRGREEGEIEGKRAWLRTIVRTRFGALPESLEARITTADSAELEALLTRVLAAERADQI